MYPDWSNVQNMMNYLIDSNNNLNPYLHPLYDEIRTKIKNKLDVSEYQSLLCNTPSKPNNLLSKGLLVDKDHPIEFKLDLNKFSDDELQPENNEVLYDIRGFNNQQQYDFDEDKTFYKQDLVENIYNMSNNPIYYLNNNSLLNNNRLLNNIEYYDDRSLNKLIDNIIFKDYQRTINKLIFKHLM